MKYDNSSELGRNKIKHKQILRSFILFMYRMSISFCDKTAKPQRQQQYTLTLKMSGQTDNRRWQKEESEGMGNKKWLIKSHANNKLSKSIFSCVPSRCEYFHPLAIPFWADKPSDERRNHNPYRTNSRTNLQNRSYPYEIPHVQTATKIKRIRVREQSIWNDSFFVNCLSVCLIFNQSYFY